MISEGLVAQKRSGWDGEIEAFVLIIKTLGLREEISPLRCASVEMTFQGTIDFLHSEALRVWACPPSD